MNVKQFEIYGMQYNSIKMSLENKNYFKYFQKIKMSPGTGLRNILFRPKLKSFTKFPQIKMSLFQFYLKTKMYCFY